MNTVMFMPMNGRRLFRRWTEKILAGDFGERDVCHVAGTESDYREKGVLMLDLFRIFIKDKMKSGFSIKSVNKELFKKIHKRLHNFVQK